MSKNAVANLASTGLVAGIIVTTVSIAELFGFWALMLVIGVLVTFVALGGISYATRD